MRTRDDNYECDVLTTHNVLKECPGQKLCSECSWSLQNGGYCSGCDEDYQQRCLKRVCNLTCDTCSGGGKARVPGCCGRSPASWRERWDRLLGYSLPDYAPEPIQINCQLIPVIYAQIKKFRIPELFPQIDAWAVPIHKAANRQGKFRSDDLKDYLGLPSDRKLILSTCAPDDYEEMLWKKGTQMNYKQHGIDYWFPGHFSIYDNDSKLYQFASAKRHQLHAIWTESQFVWFRLGEHIPIEFLSPIRNAPSVLISTNRMYSKRNFAILYQEIQIADRWFPPRSSFFVLGTYRRLPISVKRSCYEIRSNWLIRALKGRNMADRKEENLTRGELLIKNMKEVLEICTSFH